MKSRKNIETNTLEYSIDLPENIYDPFFVARQPIFYGNNQIWGYELLFRSCPDFNIASIGDEDLATFAVATSGFIRSQEDLDQTKKICINFTQTLLEQGDPKGLPPAVTVIEVLENVMPTQRLIELLIQYKQEGYLVAIDDFEGRVDIHELLELADIIKVDVLNKNLQEIEAICEVIKNIKAIRLAEKVEDRELLEDLKKLGFSLYQGYYFAKPQLLSGRKLSSTKITKLRVLQVLEEASVSSEKIEKAISADPSITYRLLRFLNSAAFGFSIKISSIRHAITLLGLTRLKNWLRMVILSDILGDKTPELYVMSLNRAKLLEELVKENQIQKGSAESMFLFGLLSLMEPMLDTPMGELMDQLPIPDDIKAGYVDQHSPYHDYLKLLTALERAMPQEIKQLCGTLDLNEENLADALLRSTVWANEMYRHIM
jgi:EAL and modified HD-GYP domain-containing signal transduction protein